MNEEELKKGCGKSLLKTPSYCLCGDATDIRTGEIAYCPTCQARLEGFQKGKLEQKKEELKRIIELQKKIRRYLIDNSRCDCLELTTKYGDISDVLFWEYEEQLQKEIGGMK